MVPGAVCAALALTAGQAENIDLELRAVVGGDSNPRLSSRNRGWVALARTSAALDYSRSLGGSIFGLSGQLRADVAEGAEQGRAVALGLEGLWSDFLVGEGRAHGLGRRSSAPSLRFDVRARYRLQVAMDTGQRATAVVTEEVEEEELEDAEEEGSYPIDAEDGELVAVSYPRPWNQLMLSSRLLLGVSKSRLELRSGYRRSLRSHEPSRSPPHFHEVSGGARWEQRWSPAVRHRLSYELGSRWFDAQTDGRGGPRVDLVHRARLSLRAKWGALRLEGGYQLRILESNRAQRSTLRHSWDLRLRYPLLDQLEAVAAVDIHEEARPGRPERGWSRVRLTTGLQARF